MKIEVFSIEKQPTGVDAYELSANNRSLIDAAFQIQNVHLSHLTTTEPVNEQVTINVFHDASGLIRWAFSGNPSEQAQEAVREAMKKPNKL
ncbi:hypothetical protein [Mucilaginibacter sp.]|jgi:hypothetical protein|uniref:hypothetical protein n=1 Tax=Mucilaginibacter sp. TaxID=1882438 RepID=UPI00356463BD